MQVIYKVLTANIKTPIYINMLVSEYVTAGPVRVNLNVYCFQAGTIPKAVASDSLA